MKLSSQEKWFLFFAILCGMSIACEYGITRPASGGLFLTTFSSRALPWVWLATVPLNLFVIYLYSRFLPKIGPLKMIGIIGIFTIAVNTFCALFLHAAPQLIFFQYAWKDIYILLMFKQFWSMVHSTITVPRAKYLYGIIFGMGTVGSILGSLIPGFFAVEIGSEKLFYFTLPVYLLLLFSYTMAFQRSGVKDLKFQTELSADLRPSEGFSLIRRSPFLTSVLFLVIAMQVSTGLIEYLFNTHLEANIFDKDLRTEYCGRIMGITNMASGLLQLMGSFLLIHFLGMKRSQFLIPFTLSLSGLFAWLVPAFGVVSFSFVFLKSIDFSLFSVLREMLYIPLKIDEKFRAKAIIDVFAHRTSKALVSICVLALQAIAGAALLPSINALSIAVFAAWMALVLIMFKKYAPALLTAK